MIEENKLHKIYNAVIEELPLTKALLTNIEINEEELQYLIKNKTLIPLDIDKYQISLPKLMNYSSLLKEDGKIDKSIKCLKICHKLYPNDGNILLKLLLIYIQTKKTKEIYDTFKLLDITDEEEIRIENNSILLLLNILFKAPKEYTEIIKKLNYNDLIFKYHSKYQNITSQNRMRRYIFENKFYKADMVLRKELNNDIKNQALKNILLTLLSQIIELENKKNTYIENLIKEEKFQQLVDYLGKRHQIRNLTLYEAYVYKISSSIVRIKQVNKIPKVTNENTSNLKEAIIGNNYKVALNLINGIHPELPTAREKEIITTLLKKVNQLIAKVILDCQNNIKKEQENKERQFILEKKKIMEESGDIVLILDSIDVERRKIIFEIVETMPELKAFVTGGEGIYKLGLRYIEKQSNDLNIEKTNENALNAYINNDYIKAISMYRKVLLTDDYIKANTCGMLGLSYLHIGNIEEAIKYMNLSIELDKYFKSNQIDYKKIIEYLKLPQTEEITEKIRNIIDKHDCQLIKYDITKEIELAHYIKENNIDIELAIKQLNLTNEQILLINLIYARDLFIEADYSKGDKIVEEVAANKNRTLKVVAFLTEIRSNRNIYGKKRRKIKKKK